MKTNRQKSAFTLPEVIIAFSVMAMVITSAVGVLAVVLRTNSDNVSSLQANGLAQEGLEAIRFIRDTNVLLGLPFDGTVPNSSQEIWGAPLYNPLSGEPAYFALEMPGELEKVCAQANLSNCLPVRLKSLAVEDPENLAQSELTLAGDRYHRIIRVEPVRSLYSSGNYDILHVNSLVYWQDSNGQNRKVVMTSELTDWR